MFQTFTGSSRRPRQVNLSGRNHNPFAATPQRSVPQGSPAAVLQAQHDRKARQQERERLQAAKALQRTWRGYRTRKEVASELRRRWDVQQQSLEQSEPNLGRLETNLQHLEHLKLLLRFCKPSRATDDICRVSIYASLFNKRRKQGNQDDLGLGWTTPLTRLTKLALEVFGLTDQRRDSGMESKVQTFQNLLRFLQNFVLLFPDQLKPFAPSYYLSLSKLLSLHLAAADISLMLQELLTLPLQQCRPNGRSIYDGLLLGLLTVPELQNQVDFDGLAAAIDPSSLTSSLQSLLKRHNFIRDTSNTTLAWLLAYYTRLHRSSTRNSLSTHNAEIEHIATVSVLLSNLSDIINGRQDVHDTTASDPLPEYVISEITSLINQQTISNLLAHANTMDSTTVQSMSHSNDAAILASYVLTLIQVFPRRSDEIRMWLYMGSTSSLSSTSSNSERLPAIKFFSAAVSRTRVFKTIYQEPHGAVALLGLKQRKQFSDDEHTRLEHEWRIVLLFLELYTFVLKIMDDEEFMSGADITGEHKSWTRQSALKLSEIKDLVVFLKNFSFAMYWYTSEINDTEQDIEPRSLKSYFGSMNESATSPQVQRKQGITDFQVVPGIQSSAISYMKGTATGLLRMLYERDSRRRFLPKDHWLMKEFDMSGFISAVLQEQKYRSENHEEDEEDEDLIDEDYDIYGREAGLIGTSRTQAVRRIERLKRLQQKSARRKRMEDTVPRLNILENMPFFIPFATRVQIFREFVRFDQEVRRNGFTDPDQWRASIMHHGFAGGASMTSRDQFIQKHSAKVRRDRVFEDAYEQFYPLGEGLKEPIQITFVDQFDTPEAGIDGGGVTKEFLTSVTSEAFTPSGGLELFVESDQHLLYPNPELVEKQRSFLRQVGFKDGSPEWNEPIRELLHQYEFLGRVVGKCLYEGILIDIHFAPFFLIKWALTGGSGSATNESGYRANINDLRDLDEGLYQGLLMLKNHPGNVEDDLGLDFTINDTISFKDGTETQTITRELRPNGANVPVTNENRLVYISYVARHRLQAQPRQQTSAFLKGLGTMIQPSWLSMFNQSELQTLIGGDSSQIDVADLRRNTLYGGVYVIGDDGQEHPTIQLFWKLMEELCDDDRRKLLKYVTSTPRAPLLGFNQLHPQFSIRDSGSDQSRLPSTSTCVNLLKLPIYSNKETMKEKLVYAINAGAGFNLS